MNDDQPLSEYKIDEKGFVVVMVTKVKNVFLLQWNFSFGTPLLEGHLRSWDTKFGPGKMLT